MCLTCDLLAYKFAWYGQRSFDCLGLERYLNLDAILSCDFGMETEEFLGEKKPQVFSLESSTFIRENWTSVFLDNILRANGDNFFNYLRELPDKLYIVAYSSTKSLDDFAKEHSDRVKLLMPDLAVKMLLDDKFKFHEMAKASNFPTFDGRIMKLSEINYKDAASDFGSPFVICFQYGSAGSGTFFIHSSFDLEMIYKSFGEREVLVGEFIEGVSINVNAAVMGNSIHVSAPSVQLVGLSECSNRQEIYCGNDFSAISVIPKTVVQNAQECVLKIGEWLANVGYKGIFGVDLIANLDKEIVYPVDLNPRFQNSTHLLTQLQILEGQIPLSIINISSQMGMLEAENHSYIEKNSLHGAQIILHNLSEKAFRIRKSILPGVYTFNQEKLVRKRDGYSLLDSIKDDEIVVSCAVPRPETLIKPGAPLFKMFTRSQVFDPCKNTLLPSFSNICKALYAEFISESAL